jgi:hypothetical protein
MGGTVNSNFYDTSKTLVSNYDYTMKTNANDGDYENEEFDEYES